MLPSLSFPTSKIFGILVILAMIPGGTAKSQQNSTTLERQGFIFELQECQVTPNSDSATVCTFLIENSSQERRSLVFHLGSTQFADSGGNVVTSSAIQIGNNTSNTSKVISDELIQGIPIKGKVIFGQAPQGNIILINLFCSIAETIDDTYSDFLGKPVDLTLYPDEFNVEFRF